MRKLFMPYGIHKWAKYLNYTCIMSHNNTYKLSYQFVKLIHA